MKTTELLRKQEITKFCIMGAAIIVAYIPTFIWMIERWLEKDTYYSHGFLVPLISAFVIWQKKDVLKALEIKPNSWGWLLFVPAIIVHVVSALLRVYFTSGFSILPLLAGLILLTLGARYLRQLLFPLFFLVFMIPLPLVAIANISFKLKIFAAQVSTVIVNHLGVPAIRDGSVIKTMHAYLMVEDPCSGIRSLIALIALGALMAYFSRLSKPRKAILFLSSVPVAVSSNIIRIVGLCLISEMYGMKYATGFFHDAMGILVFVFAFFGLMLINKVLE